ncbi:unnamed protein product [Amoebophrya sp. A25]|nr:unnamed protein product [Amoebophrya sp. A25]|eukprot:GSA25T00027625001.1
MPSHFHFTREAEREQVCFFEDVRPMISSRQLSLRKQAEAKAGATQLRGAKVKEMEPRRSAAGRILQEQKPPTADHDKEGPNGWREVEENGRSAFPLGGSPRVSLSRCVPSWPRVGWGLAQWLKVVQHYQLGRAASRWRLTP